MTTAMIKNRGKVINKLALVLLTIVVLELVLIGDQVQPVKAIKKKIYLKKLKKLLPLLALIKPKKKIILLPIPIPMFKNQGHHNAFGGHYQPQGRPTQPFPYQPPMSFMMMGSEHSQVDHQRPNMVGTSGSMLDAGPQQMLPMSMILEPQVGSTITGPQVAPRQPNPSEPAVPMPSMTMTIQSDSGGGSAIELSTSMMNPNASLSGALLQRPSLHPVSSKWQPQQQQFDQFDEPAAEQLQQQQPAGGEHYYSSPWTAKQPLSSPAKLYRANNERVPAPQPVGATGATQRPQVALMMVRSSRRPAPSPTFAPLRLQPQPQRHEHEFEELVPIGPPQMMTVYQTPNGQLHLSPPPPPGAQPAAPTANSEPPVDELGGEVQTSSAPVGPAEPALEPQPQPQPARQASKGGRQLASPAVKGKQLQPPSSKRKPAAGTN